MGFGSDKEKQLEKTAEELGIELDDGGYRDEHGIEVYKVWTDSKENSKKLYDVLITRGFSRNRTFLDGMRLMFDAS